MKAHPAQKREAVRLKSILSIRERQCQIATKAMKEVIKFRSAHKSVFETEVRVLQRIVLEALQNMENVQRNKPLTQPKALTEKHLLNQLYGRFTEHGPEDE